MRQTRSVLRLNARACLPERKKEKKNCYFRNLQFISFAFSKSTQSDEEDAAEDIHTRGMAEDEDEIKIDT